MHRTLPQALVCLLAALTLTGCSTTFDTAPNPTTSTLGTITGQLYGGRQPIAGAQIYLYAPGTTAYAGSGIAPSASNASTSLLTSAVPAVCGTGASACQDTNGNYYVVTTANGAFSISGDYACTSGTPLYLYAVGGNPGAGANSAAGLLAILGQCPSNGPTGLASLVVNINELSTVAAAYSFAGFASDATHVSTSGSALSLTGIQNAFANSAQLYQLNGLGGGPSGGGNANATTPGSGTNGGTGTVPQTELNSLANILAACVNSIGPASPACSTLLAKATSTGATGGTVPTDTATAAINIAHFPVSNVTTLFNLQPIAGNPFTPALSAAPANFTISLAFTGGGLTQTSGGGAPDPKAICIDGSGNAWIADVQTGKTTSLIKFSPLGVPNGTTGYNINNYYPWSCAVDASSTNIWIASRYSSAVLKFNIAGSTTTSYATASNTWDVELDGSGNLWVPLYSNSSIIEINPGTGAVTQTITGNGLNSPTSLALEPGTAGNVWVTDSGGYVSAFTNAGAAYAEPTGNNLYFPTGSAIDSSGSIWFANQTSKVTKIAPSGTSGTYFSLGSDLDAIAIDGANNAWVTDRNGSTVFELSNSGTNLSTSSGFALNPATFYNGTTNVTTQPDALAIDGSGNVWYTSFNNGTLRELIGAAVPVTTPIAYAVANSQLGTRP